MSTRVLQGLGLAALIFVAWAFAFSMDSATAALGTNAGRGAADTLPNKFHRPASRLGWTSPELHFRSNVLGSASGWKRNCSSGPSATAAAY